MSPRTTKGSSKDSGDAVEVLSFLGVPSEDHTRSRVAVVKLLLSAIYDAWFERCGRAKIAGKGG